MKLNIAPCHNSHSSTFHNNISIFRYPTERSNRPPRDAKMSRGNTVVSSRTFKPLDPHPEINGQNQIFERVVPLKAVYRDLHAGLMLYHGA